MKRIKELFFSEKYEAVIVILFFLAGTAAYFLLGHFDKAISIYMDEMYYYDMARGIFKGNGFEINNFVSDFQKIAYPLLLAPFFAIKDGVVRITVISLMNCALIVSSIFPAWLISRELGLTRAKRVAVLAVTVLFPDMMYSMTFMSENLFWPVIMWIMYLWLRNFKSPKIKYAIIMGALSYIAYLCKEIALAVPIACVGFELLFPIMDHALSGNSENKRLRERFRIKNLVYSIISTAVFAVLFIAVKLAIFSQMENLYKLSNNASLLTDPLIWLFMLKAVTYYISMLLIASLVIPFVYPLLKYRFLDNANRGMFCFTILYSLIVTATITYTITIYEEMYNTILRSLLRYYGPILLTEFFVFLKSFDIKTFTVGKKQVWTVLLAVTIAACANFNGIISGAVVDQSLLNWYRELWVSLDAGGLVRPLGQVYMSILIIIVVCIAKYLTDKKTKEACGIFTAIFLTLFTADNTLDYLTKKSTYQVSGERINEILAINEYFSELPEDKSILFIDRMGFPGEAARCMDTYFDYDRDLYFSECSFIKQIEPGSSILFSDIELKYPTFLRQDFPAESFEYIIVENNNVDMYGKKLANVELIDEISSAELSVYKNTDIYSISFVSDRSFVSADPV